MSLEQQLQEEEYDFPYHYIPVAKNGYVESFRYWSWGYKYMASMPIIFKQLENIKFKSLLDVGCGDGRITRELSKNYPDIEVSGVDYSPKAISIAKLFNPIIPFRVENIAELKSNKKYDVLTLIEVLEHIPIASISGFLKGLQHLMTPSSLLLITIPHSNQKLNEKHFQHFNTTSLKQTLEGYFSIQSFFYFDPISFEMKLWSKVLNNPLFIIKSPFILKMYHRRYTNSLITKESKCLRMGVVCKIK